MNLTKPLVLAAFAAALAATPALAREDLSADPFMFKYDMDKDGMMSKKEVMMMVEKMFDRQDTKKMGKLDKKQFELFLQELMKNGA
jgi:hypothetical protein